MVGTKSSSKEVLAYFPTPILPNIGIDSTLEDLIEIHWLIIGNAASVESDLGGGRHGHLSLTMAADYYMSQIGYAFVPPHNPVDYLLTMGNSQDQALVTERFQQNQALFRRCTTV